MRRFLPLVLATSTLMPVLAAADAPATTPMPAVPTSDASPAPAMPAVAPAPVAVKAAEAKPAAEVKPVEPAPAIEANLPEGAFSATIKANSNVRFGPNRNAKVALCTKVSGPIVVLGPARGAPDWLLVRLPRETSVWMHRKVLTPQDGGKTFVVNEERAKARDDATLGANIVCEVEKGEIVEAKGRQVGDWFAVQVPSATAYVHRSVLMGNEHLDNIPKTRPVNLDYIALTWETAQKRYDAYQAALSKDLEVAAILDWTYLSQQLGEVVAKHPDTQIQAVAQRMRDGIAKVVKAVEKIQGEHNVVPQRQVPGGPVIPEPVETVVQNPPPAIPAIPAPAGQEPAKATPPRIPTATIPTDIPKVVRPAPAPLYPAEGIVMEQAFPGVGVNHVVVDANQNVIAFLKVKDGCPLQMSEYFWRYVGVKGEKVAVDPAKHNLKKDIPLFLVEDLVLIKQ